MTSRRRLRRAQCGNKIGHEDESAAWTHLRSLGSRNSGVYRCRWCGRGRVENWRQTAKALQWQLITNPARIWQTVKIERRARKWGNPLHVWKKFRALKQRIDGVEKTVSDLASRRVRELELFRKLDAQLVTELERRVARLESIIEERTADS